MSSMQITAALLAGSGVLIFALAIPLVRRRVPPNGLYGVRTKASFASEADWYRINAIGGRYLVVAGLVILVAGGVGFFLPPSLEGAYAFSAISATLLAVIIPCVRLCFLKPSQRPWTF